MASLFIVRIQLQKAKSSEYRPLYEKAAEHGFRDWLEGQDQGFKLPRGVYRIMGESGDEVRTLAKKAAESTGKDYRLVVVQANGWWGSGLAKHQPGDAAKGLAKEANADDFDDD